MLAKTDAPYQREGSWQLIENNGRGSGWKVFLGSRLGGGLPLFIAPSSILTLKNSSGRNV